MPPLPLYGGIVKKSVDAIAKTYKKILQRQEKEQIIDFTNQSQIALGLHSVNKAIFGGFFDHDAAVGMPIVSVLMGWF